MRRIALAGLLGAALLLGACSDADVASQRLSTQADYFQIERRVVFYNGITGEFMLTIEGLCSLGNFDAERELTVTCKTGPNDYKKDFLGLSDNVTYFVEQLTAVPEDTYHYLVVLKPATILPEIRLNQP